MPMPPPPPPGPPPPGPPPPPAFNPSSSKSKGGSVDNRGALLQSIRQGTKLKKTVTNDKSAPILTGRVAGNTNSNNDTGRFGSSQNQTNSNNTSSQTLTNGLGLGGLFAGGMPKLRPTGRAIGASQPSLSVANSSSEHVRKPSPEPTRQNVVSSTTNQLNEVLKKQLSNDIRNRGPPPQPPTSRSTTLTDSSESSNIPPSRSPFINKNLPDSSSPLTANKSTLHQSKSSNTFLHGSATSINTGSNNSIHSNNTQTSKPAISHGKPNVAPKPPAIVPTAKPATPPKKLMVNGRVPVSRAQSMRVPRSPPVAPTDNPPFPPTINGKDFGTIRGVPTAFHQSQENLSVRQTHNSRTLPVNFVKNAAPNPPSFNNRPLAPPPSRPPAPPPPSRTGSNMNLKAPLSPPPPPPVQMPPPPPPHRTSPAPPPPPSHTRPPPAIPTNGPPPPPIRNSSMRNGSSNAVSPSLDFDTRFSNLFHPVSDFPAPAVFRGLNKLYNSKNGECDENCTCYLYDFVDNCKILNTVAY